MDKSFKGYIEGERYRLMLRVDRFGVNGKIFFKDSYGTPFMWATKPKTKTYQQILKGKIKQALFSFTVEYVPLDSDGKLFLPIHIVHPRMNDRKYIGVATRNKERRKEESR